MYVIFFFFKKADPSTPACVYSSRLCQITFIMMRLRTRHQADICADSSGVFTQRAAGQGIVRTWKGTSLWGRSGTQEHTVILVCKKKKKKKKKQKHPWDHTCILKDDTLRHMHACTHADA